MVQQRADELPVTFGRERRRVLQIAFCESHVGEGDGGGCNPVQDGEIRDADRTARNERHRLEVVERRQAGRQPRRIPDASEIVDEIRRERRYGGEGPPPGAAPRPRGGGPRGAPPPPHHPPPRPRGRRRPTDPPPPRPPRGAHRPPPLGG